MRNLLTSLLALLVLAAPSAALAKVGYWGSVDDWDVVFRPEDRHCAIVRGYQDGTSIMLQYNPTWGFARISILNSAWQADFRSGEQIIPAMIALDESEWSSLDDSGISVFGLQTATDGGFMADAIVPQFFNEFERANKLRYNVNGEVGALGLQGGKNALYELLKCNTSIFIGAY